MGFFSGAIIFLALIIFALRILLRIIYPDLAGVDVFYHLLIAREISENSHKIPDRIPNLILPAEFNYPYFLHWILSYFPTKHHLSIIKFTGFLLDLIHAILIGGLAYVFANRLALPKPLQMALTAASLYLISPYLTREGASSATLSPRAFGELLLTAAIGIFSLALITNRPGLLAVSVFIGAFVFISSKFGIQAFIGFGLIGMFFFGIKSFLLVAFSFGLSIILSRGKSLKVILGQIRHSCFYKKAIAASYTGVREKNNFSADLCNLRNAFKNPRAAFHTLHTNSFLLLFTQYPLFILFLWFVFCQDYGLWGGYPLMSWVWIFLVLMVITSQGYLKFLGEAERYMNFAAFPLSFIGAITLIHFNQPVTGLLFVVLVIIFNSVNFLRFTRSHGKADSLPDVIEYLNTIGDSKRILVNPVNFSFRLAYETRHRLLYFGANLDIKKFSIAQFFDFFGKNFPHINPGLQKIYNHYAFDLFIVENQKANDYALENATKLFQGKFYSVYEWSAD